MIDEETPVVMYIDPQGEEHVALVTSINQRHNGFVSLAYVENGEVKQAQDVAHEDHPKFNEANKDLPRLVRNGWKELLGKDWQDSYQNGYSHGTTAGQAAAQNEILTLTDENKKLKAQIEGMQKPPAPAPPQPVSPEQKKADAAQNKADNAQDDADDAKGADKKPAQAAADRAQNKADDAQAKADEVKAPTT